MNKDDEQIRLLSIFHYVVAGLLGLFSLFPLIHVSVGIAMVTGMMPNKENDPFMPVAGWLFISAGTIFILCGLTFTVCVALAGRYLRQHRHYMFCLVMAAITCTFMPFGTVLGVFTIVVLQRDSVRLLFGRANA